MKIEKVEKLVANLHDKTENIAHIRNLKQALSHGLVLKNFHKVIKFQTTYWYKHRSKKKSRKRFWKKFFLSKWIMKTDDIYKDIAEDVEIRFDTSNYELDRPSA